MEVQGEEVKERSFMPGVSAAQISRRNNVKGNCSCSPGEPCTQEAEMRCSGGWGVGTLRTDKPGAYISPPTVISFGQFTTFLSLGPVMYYIKWTFIVVGLGENQNSA